MGKNLDLNKIRSEIKGGITNGHTYLKKYGVGVV
jgi:hypothetical protein